MNTAIILTRCGLIPYSVRLSYNPSKEWGAAGVKWMIKSPEVLEPLQKCGQVYRFGDLHQNAERG